MPLHLVKLCVGVATPAELEARMIRRLAECQAQGRFYESLHPTRMVPKRAEELLAGGSIYWVMKGHITCRQSLKEIRVFTDEGGKGGKQGEGRLTHCHLVFESSVIAVRPVPRRPFQGWRYLNATDAPPDLFTHDADTAQMPEEMRENLIKMGLL
jgi:hypothetical protein